MGSPGFLQHSKGMPPNVYQKNMRTVWEPVIASGETISQKLALDLRRSLRQIWRKVKFLFVSDGSSIFLVHIYSPRKTSGYTDSVRKVSIFLLRYHGNATYARISDRIWETRTRITEKIALDCSIVGGPSNLHRNIQKGTGKCSKTTFKRIVERFCETEFPYH